MMSYLDTNLITTTLIGRNTNKIQTSIDNIYMNDEDIERIAELVAEKLYQKAQKNINNDSFIETADENNNIFAF